MWRRGCSSRRPSPSRRCLTDRRRPARAAAARLVVPAAHQFEALVVQLRRAWQRGGVSGAVVVGAASVVTVCTTVVAGSVTVSFTVRGTVSAALLRVVAGQERRGEDTGERGRPARSAAQPSGPACATGASARSTSSFPRRGESVAKRVDELGGGRLVARCSGSFARPRARCVVDLGGSWDSRLDAGGDRGAHVGHRLGGRGLALEGPRTRQAARRRPPQARRGRSRAWRLRRAPAPAPGSRPCRRPCPLR